MTHHNCVQDRKHAIGTVTPSNEKGKILTFPYVKKKEYVGVMKMIPSNFG